MYPKQQKEKALDYPTRKLSMGDFCLCLFHIFTLDCFSLLKSAPAGSRSAFLLYKENHAIVAWFCKALAVYLDKKTPNVYNESVTCQLHKNTH